MDALLRVLWWNLDWSHAGRNEDQIEAVVSLEPRPDVVGLGELSASRSEAWRKALEPLGYRFAPEAPDLPRRKLRVALVSRAPISVPRPRFVGLRPRAHRSAIVDLGSAPVEVHATHVPNGSSNGWVKGDHLNALRTGLEPPHVRPQILMGDFNTPQSESGGRLITFGQNPDGSLQEQRTTRKPFTPERPFDGALWDKAERAVLEGLPNECSMPDAFRALHPDAEDFTWAPREGGDGRRFDHVYASRDLVPRAVRHVSEWRHDGLSDHSAVEAAFELQPRLN